MEFISPLTYGAPVFLVMILLELVYSKSHDNDELYDWKDLAASFTMGVGSVPVNAAMKLISSYVIFTLVYNLFNHEVDGVMMNVMGYASFGFAWYVWFLCQLADDFSYYWFHRANHEVRLFWAAHIVHHSSDHFNLGTGVRNGWFTLMYKPLFYIWMAAIGFHPDLMIFCLGIESLWQFQLHTIYVPKLGFLEKILNTHTMHQVHHSQNLEYLDKNHGGYLNIFDKIFGTWKPLDDNAEIKYGVIHPPNSHNPLVILTHEYGDIIRDVRKAKSLKEVFMYIFGPPGWSADGSTLTVKQLQRAMASGEFVTPKDHWQYAGEKEVQEVQELA